jgi:AraC family transcriptional regulator
MSKEERKAAFPVRLAAIDERTVAYIRVMNAVKEGRVIVAFKAITDWAKSRNNFQDGNLFGISVDDPHVTPKHLYRYEVSAIGKAQRTALDDGFQRVAMRA